MNDQHHWKWLARKLQEWVAGGILAPEQADLLLAQAPGVEARHHLLTRILVGLSALLFGLGVVSFFAFNWQLMPKWLKLAVVFVSFLAVHGAGVAFDQKPSQKTMAEFLHLIGTMLFGAGIMLIAQIYHIDEHFPNGILLWSLGALAMAYVLDSTPQLLLGATLIVVWQLAERSYDVSQPWVVAGCAAALVPLAANKKHPFAVSIAAVAVIVVTAIQLSYHPVGIVGSLLFLGVLCLGVGLQIRRTTSPQCAVPLEVAGSLLYFSMLLALTFEVGIDEGLVRAWRRAEIANLALPIVVAAVNLIVWALLCLPLNSVAARFRRMSNRHLVLAFAGFLTAVILWLIAKPQGPADRFYDPTFIGLVLFNLLALVHGTVLIFSGTRAGRVGTSFLGCLLVVIVILSRFINYSDDLLTRSIAFVVAGGFMLWIALKTSRVRKEIRTDVVR